MTPAQERLINRLREGWTINPPGRQLGEGDMKTVQFRAMGFTCRPPEGVEGDAFAIPPNMLQRMTANGYLTRWRARTGGPARYELAPAWEVEA